MNCQYFPISHVRSRLVIGPSASRRSLPNDQSLMSNLSRIGRGIKQVSKNGLKVPNHSLRNRGHSRQHRWHAAHNHYLVSREFNNILRCPNNEGVSVKQPCARICPSKCSVTFNSVRVRTIIIPREHYRRQSGRKRSTYCPFTGLAL